MHTAHFLHGAPKAAYRAHPRDASQSPSQSQARIGESIASTRNLATGQCHLQRSASQAAMATALAASLNLPGCDVRSGVLRFPERGCVAISRTGGNRNPALCCDFRTHPKLHAQWCAAMRCKAAIGGIRHGTVVHAMLRCAWFLTRECACEVAMAAKQAAKKLKMKIAKKLQNN